MTLWWNLRKHIWDTNNKKHSDAIKDRNSIIKSWGIKVRVHNGKNFTEVQTLYEKMGKKFGILAPTKIFYNHKKKKVQNFKGKKN